MTYSDIIRERLQVLFGANIQVRYVFDTGYQRDDFTSNIIAIDFDFGTIFSDGHGRYYPLSGAIDIDLSEPKYEVTRI